MANSINFKADIIYDTHSDKAKRLSFILKNHSFANPTSDSKIVILDRRFDEITPLLIPWTYQAMIYEYFKVSTIPMMLKSVNGEFSLHDDDDLFWAKNKTSTFGEIGINIQEMVTLLKQVVAEKSGEYDSISSIKKVLEEFPEYKKLSSTISRHLAIIEQISKVIEEEKCMAISEFEQLMLANNNFDLVFKAFCQFLESINCAQFHRLRVALIFLLKFFNHSQFSYLMFFDKLRMASFTEKEILV